jgi:protein disulfide isomerase
MCSNENDQYLCEKYKVNQEKPVLKFFHSSFYNPFDYDRVLDSKALYQWMDRKMTPNPQEVSNLSEINALRDKYHAQNVSVVVGFFPNQDTQIYRKWLEITTTKALEFLVYAECIACAEDALKEFDVEAKQQKIVVLNYDKSVNGTTNFATLINYLAILGNPALDNLNNNTLIRFQTSKIPVCIIYLDENTMWNNKDMVEIYNNVKEVAKIFLGKVMFFYAHYEKFVQDHFKRVRLEPLPLPKVIMFVEGGGLAYVFNSSGTEPLGQWVSNVLADKATPVLRSQPVPAKNDGPVKIAVAESITRYLNDPELDTVMMFYVPKTVEYIAFDPIYHELAKNMSEVEKLVFSKIDITENDIPRLRMPSLPAIYVYPAHNKDNPVLFEGKRTAAELRKFLNKHCKKSREFLTEKRKKAANLENKRDEL